jgi:hypothetical protein
MPSLHPVRSLSACVVVGCLVLSAAGSAAAKCSPKPLKKPVELRLTIHNGPNGTVSPGAVQYRIVGPGIDTQWLPYTKQVAYTVNRSGTYYFHVDGGASFKYKQVERCVKGTPSSVFPVKIYLAPKKK